MSAQLRVIDLCAGAGGWDLACRKLGLDVVGVEIDPHCIATRAVVGLATMPVDVRTLFATPPPWTPFYDGLVASPPCQDFSKAGKRRGLLGPTGKITDDVLRIIEATRPTWLCLEQVPTVLITWKRFAKRLGELGYRTWCGVVSAEAYGVPQMRKRALLLGSLERQPGPPAASHQSVDARRLRQASLAPLPPPVTMAKALDWTTPGWWQERPATTIVSEFRPDLVTKPGHKVREKEVFVTRQHDGAKVTPSEAGVLQGFPVDYPWQGPPTAVRRQIGNAIPPPLAEAAIRAVLSVRAPTERTEP